MSLTSCLKEATALSAANRAAVMKRAAELRAEGLAAGQAGLQAATELRDSVAAELASAEEAGQLLQAQTAADLQAKVDREQAGMDAERRQRDADQARLRREAEDRDNRARADQTVDDFQLGQSAEQQMSGMGDLFGDDPGTMFDGEVTEDPQTKEITHADRAKDDWADSYGLTVDDFVVAIRAAAESVPTGAGGLNDKLGHISTIATMPKPRQGISQADFVELQADKTDKLRAEADRADKKFEADLAEQADGTLEPMLANLRKYAEHPVRVQRILAKYRSVGGSQARQANEVHVMARAYWKRGRFAEIGQLLRQSARNKTAFGNAYSHDGGWKWDDVNEQLERSLDKAGTSALNALGPRRGADVLAALGYREDGKYSLRERADAMKDAAAKRKALDDLNDALGDLGDILGKNVRKNLTPEQEQKLLPVLTRVMDAAFRAGYYSFRQAARFVLDKIRAALGDDAADAITLDHLQGAYIGMAGRYRDDPEFADRQPDAKRAVIDIESKEELENGDAPAPGNDLERSGGPGLTAGDENLRGAVPAGSAAARPGAGQPDAAAGAVGDGPDGAARLADGDAAADGERGNQPRRRGRAGAAPGAARGGDGERSAPAGDARVQPAAPAGEETADADSHAAAVARRVAAQKLAGSKPVTFADKANIDETLPLLLPEQRDDVLKAEQRFAAGHVGILFTNGTGTGKTFTGLGVVKRMHQAGKRNILILAPDDKIIGDWIRSAKMIGLDIGQLESTKDAGKGVVITTYANAGMNLSLADRDWDAVVADESHNLSSNKDGDLTAAAHTLNAITLHPDGVYTRAAMIHRELNGEITRLNAEAKSARASDDEREWARAAQLEARLNKLSREYEAKRDAIKADVQARQGQRPRAVFLSATPFAWVPNLNYANGYLFDWSEGKGDDLASGSGWGHGYNSGNHREQFYMQHFGYRMRYNRLTRPEAGVDVALMERQFNTYLKRTGALSGRQLEVGPDYDRRFIAVESTLGRRIDEALAWDREDGFDYTTATEAEKSQRRADDEIRDKLRKAFAFQQRQYFLEAIKARALVPYIQAQLDAGRKVVVFHDFKKGGVTQNPFSRQVVMGQGRPNETDKDAYDRWAARFPDLAGLDIAGMGSPIEVLSEAFGDRLSLFNGDIKAKDRETAVARFNDDAEGPRVILVQSAKAAGWSGHDTTGKHQRVLINLGMPTRPFTAIQQEGRIYRTGQASDAMQRYASTGTSWERTAFAEKLAERAETAENLAMGESARALKQAFIDAYENADDYPPGHEGEGKGGKEADRASNAVVSAFDLAKTAYWAQQKRTQRNKSREGTDYFATPEPIGLKLVEWLDLRAGETGMEPSAGHGAIARWFPEHIPTVAVELSDELRSRLGLVFNGNHARIREGRFEDLDVGANKADGVAMNPPFGLGGSLAIPHLAKAVKHLRNGGRVAAIIPRGAADKKLDAFLETEDGQALRWVADITLPGLTFNRAGAGVVARIVVFDKGIDPDGQAITRDFTSIEDINELFERLENMDVPRRGKPMPTAEELIAATRTADAPPTREERAAIREVQKAEKEGRKATGADLAAQLGLELVDYTTSKGKLIKGVLRSDLTKDQVAQFSSAPFWMRDRRAWFIRDHELAKAHELFPFKGKPAADDDVRFSLAAEQTEPFYSELARQVEGVAMRAAPASGWLQWLKGLPAKGVKPDEIEWSGLPEWLELQAGKITREQVVEYLRANGVRVTETVLSDEAAQRLPAGWQVRPSNADDDANYEWVLVDDQGEIRGEGETEREAMEDGWDPDVAADGNSKYGQYTLPGGTNYREVLLTLPGAKPTMRKQWAAWDGDELVSVSPNGPGRDWAARGWRIEERMVPDKQASERAGQYQSAHWDQPNVLAHIRLNDRTTVEPLTAQQEEDNRKRAALQARADELGKKIGKAARDSRIAGDIRREELLAKLRPLVRAGQMSPVEMTRQLDDAAFAEAGPEVVAMTKERDAILKSMPAEHKPRTAHVLFVEEIQSDWAQEGKKKGFAPTESPTFEVEVKLVGSWHPQFPEQRDKWRVTVNGQDRGYIQADDENEARYKATANEQNRRDNSGKPPSAPFVDKTDKWVALALKRIIKMAVDEGYDKVAFVNGEQSAERYDLSKQISRVEFTRTSGGVGPAPEGLGPGLLKAYDTRGKEVVSQYLDDPAQAEDYVGKEVAQRLLEQPGKATRSGGTGEHVRSLEGLQLKVGGEGMRAFYDKIVPAALKDVLRKTGGGKVETIGLPSASEFDKFDGIQNGAVVWTFDTRYAAERWAEAGAGRSFRPASTDALQQPGFTVTPAMREKAAGGMPLFRLVDAVDRPDTGVDTAAYGRTSPEDRAAIRAAESRFRAARPDLQLDAVPARAGAETGQPLRGADRARVAAAELARRMFDKRVVFFRSNTPFANGFFRPADDGRIFLNADSRVPHMAVLGHELLHAMRRDRPDLYDMLKARVMAVSRDTGQKDLLLQLNREKAGLPKLDQDILDEEFIADVVGDRFMEPEFWAAMAKDQPGAFQRVVAAVRRFLDDVIQALTQVRPFNTNAYLADVRAARDAVAEAMRQYSGGEVGAMTGATDNDIRFSLAGDAEPGLGNQALRDFLKATRTGTSNRFNALHKTISTQLHKARTNPDFARVFNIAQDYEQDVSRAASRPAQAAPDVLPAHDNLRSAFSSVLHGDRDKAVLDKVGRALFAGTLENGPEPDNGVIWSAAALRERFGLDDRGIELYRQARKAIGASLDETAAALAYQMVKKFAPQLRGAVRRRPDQARVMIETVLEPMADGDPAIAEALADAMAVFDRAAELKAGGYAPLMRFGRYAVDVVGEDGERLHFERFDTELQAKMAEQRLAREYPGATVERSTMSEEAYKLFAGVDPETVALFAQQLGNRIDGTALQEWYRKAVSDRSAMKRMIGPRKGMAGYSPDLQRVLASFITSNARLSARQMNMGDMAAQIADMQERRVAGDVVDEAIRLRDYLDNPDEPFKGLRSLMFTWYLGGSVASAAVNLTQPLMMTWPYLSQFGGAASALTNAVREAMTGKVADTELAKAMQRAADEGKVDPQEVHHLYREGMSTMIDRLPTGNDLKARAQGFSTLWGAFFGAAENFNRRITFIAAYRMAKADATLGDPYKFAIRAIDETQGIYNKSNRPNWARGTGSFGALGVAAFTFKQYSIAYVELLVRMAKSGPQGKRAALAMLGMLVLASGLQGLPGMEDLEDLIDTAAQMMGMRGNSQAALRESLVDAFGSSVADAIMYGPASGLPFDITSRMGLGDLLPSTGILKPSNERRRGQELAEILGPMGGFASQVGDFTTALDSGAGMGKAIAAFSPLAVKNALMGMHMMEDGYYSDTAGRRVTDTSDLDAGFKFIGFQPQSVASVRRPERLVAQDISRVKGVEADIVRLRAEAIVERDQAKRDRAAAMLRDWNQANPELRIRIKDSQVVQRVKQMRRTSGERILNTAPRETRRALAETL